MRSMLIPAFLGGLVLIGLWTPEVLAQKKKVEIQKKWSGTVADRDLRKTAPEVIVTKAELEKIWKAWKIEGELPTIDFKKTIVVVVTSLQGGLSLSDATLDEKGNLELIATVTLERAGSVPGFRFVLATVNREGIVSVRGKKVSEVSAQKKKVEIQKKWSGTVADEELFKTAPDVIVSSKKLETIWKAWKIDSDLPTIDFKKHLVVVVLWRSSSFDPSVTLNEKGDLEVLGVGTLEKLPGFRFMLGVVSREGVVTVNGKKIPHD